MIPRLLSKKLLESAEKFPVVALTGPRQSGKTTLARTAFAKKPYVSFEDLDTRDFALRDPRGFLNQYPKGAIFDEVQRVPQIFSYLQTLVDNAERQGMFILTGSQQFMLLETLSQTLAGRVRLLKLLPFSLEEIKRTRFALRTLEEALFKGMYPRIYDKKISPRDWYPDYIQTYIERDVRFLKNIGNLTVFQRFIKMCAARTGQLLNLSSLANDCGITHNTAKAWISVLEASFILYLLKPHHENFNKRLVKMPKLYFYDTGLVCSLLGIENQRQLETHPLRGNLFETFILAELTKWRWNQGLPLHLYFWRDKTGHEIDCLFEKGRRLLPIEMTSGRTITEDSFKHLNYWRKIARSPRENAFLVYAGNQEQKRRSVTVIGWKLLDSLTRALD